MRDDELVAAYVRERSEAAFGGLLERYLPLVYGAALRQVRDPGMAGDVAQAVFLVLAKKAGALRGGALAGWLLGVTHLAARDAMKRAAARRRHEAEAGRMRSEGAVEAGEIEAVTAALDGAMAKLVVADRTALALRYLQGQSLGEVGAALAVSPETAGKRVQRAVGRLRKVLARERMERRADVIEKGLGACFVAAAPQGLKMAIGQAVSGHVPATAVSVALAKEVTRMTMISTVKTVAAAVLVVAGVATPAYVGGPRESMMAALGMHVLPSAASRYFDNAPKHLDRVPGFAQGAAGTVTFLNTAMQGPATFEFRTREGGVGVLRLQVQGDAGKTCYVRCKLWRSGGTP